MCHRQPKKYDQLRTTCCLSPPSLHPPPVLESSLFQRTLQLPHHPTLKPPPPTFPSSTSPSCLSPNGEERWGRWNGWLILAQLSAHACCLFAALPLLSTRGHCCSSLTLLQVPIAMTSTPSHQVCTDCFNADVFFLCPLSCVSTFFICIPETFLSPFPKSELEIAGTVSFCTVQGNTLSAPHAVSVGVCFKQLTVCFTFYDSLNISSSTHISKWNKYIHEKTPKNSSGWRVLHPSLGLIQSPSVPRRSHFCCEQLDCVTVKTVLPNTNCNKISTQVFFLGVYFLLQFTVDLT